MPDRPVSFSPSGPPRTVLDPEPSAAVDALTAALATSDPGSRRDAVSAVVARWPEFLDGWARLGELGRDPVESYAAFRVGYHRGLDRLRRNGWRGSGEVRWDATKPDGQPRRGVDGSRAIAAFGFKAHTTFEEGLRLTLDWYLANRGEAESRAL